MFALFVFYIFPVPSFAQFTFFVHNTSFLIHYTLYDTKVTNTTFIFLLLELPQA